MQLKLFSFSKIEKNPKIIEEKINDFLKDNTFKFCCQSESTNSGKFNVSLYYENKKSNTRVKVFKNSNSKDLEKEVNEFLETDITMKWSCQSSASSTIYVVLFYELGKANAKKENKDQG